MKFSKAPIFSVEHSLFRYHQIIKKTPSSAKTLKLFIIVSLFWIMEVFRGITEHDLEFVLREESVA